MAEYPSDTQWLKLLIEGRKNMPLIGEAIQQPWLYKFIGISGILFDLLVVPALLWKPTRKIAFGCSVVFHLFNSAVLHIGVFPYMSLAFTVFFFEPETIRRIFLKKKKSFTAAQLEIPSYSKLLLTLGGIYFFIQLVLPIRHHFIKDDVLWTEEGHRLSWRMMLRSRSGRAVFTVVDKSNKKSHHIRLSDYLTKKQKRRVAVYPDFLWQFAQHLKKVYAEKGMDIEVYVDAKVSINRRPRRQFIDKTVDLAAEEWDHFRHHEWILPSDEGLAKE